MWMDFKCVQWITGIKGNLDITNLYTTKSLVQQTIFLAPEIVKSYRKEPRYTAETSV